MNWTINAIGFPSLLGVVLSLVYKGFDKIPDRWKAHVAVGIGGLLGIGLLVYNSGPWNPKQVVDAFVYGGMQGAAAVGLYEIQKAYGSSPRT